MSEWILENARKIEEKIIMHRRFLHKNAEAGFEVEKTSKYVFETLEKLGCKPRKIGRNGVVAKISGERSKYAFSSFSLSINLDEKTVKKVTKNENIPYGNSKRILLRADMDALPMDEKTDLPFKSENGCMHSCGHDMHTAMLLGAAEILSKNKDKFSNEVILLFQPAEETLSGARDMIDADILEEYSPDLGIMIHVVTNANLDTGTLILSKSELIAPSADFFEIEINGKGGHGAMASESVDPILIGAHIIIALEELITREFIGENGTAITIGSFSGGKAANVIPETVKIKGTVRTYSDETRKILKNRLNELVKLQASVFNGTAKVMFTSGCPTFKNNTELAKSAEECLKNAVSHFSFADKKHMFPSVFLNEQYSARSSLASEDFSYFSHKIPSILLGLAAGNSKDGYNFPLHNPKTAFDERALRFGAIALTILGANLK